MPKIPTYDQLGQRVKAPTTQLGLKSADFASANLAVAGSFNRLSNVAYEFGMKEKAENTKAATSEIKALYNDQSNDFIRNSKSLDTASAQAELIDFDKKFEKNYLNRGLSTNQIKDIKTNMTLYQSSKMQVHKNLAFDKGRDRNSTKHNKALNAIMTGMASYVDGPLKEAWRDEAKQIFATAIENGETANFDYKTFEDFSKATEINDFAYDSSNASSIEQIESIKKKLLYGNYSPEEKIKIGVMLDKENDRVESEYVDAMQREVFLNPELLKNETKYEASLKKLQSIKNVIIVKNIKGEILKINPSKLPTALLERVASRVELARNEQLSKELNNNSNALTSKVEGMSLKELTNLKIEKEFPNVTDYKQLQYLRNIKENEIEEKAKKAINNAKIKIIQIKANIRAGGGLTADNKLEAEKAISQLNLADETLLAESFKLDLNAAVVSQGHFQSIKFSSSKDTLTLGNQLLQNFRDSKNIKDEMIYNSYIAQVGIRDGEIKNDFIRYYVSQNKDVDVQSPEFSSKMIDIQRKMNIKEKDIKAKTNADIILLFNEYDSLEPTEAATFLKETIDLAKENNTAQYLVPQMMKNGFSEYENLTMINPLSSINLTFLRAKKVEETFITSKLDSLDVKAINQNVSLEFSNFRESAIGKSMYGSLLSENNRANGIDKIEMAIAKTARYIKAQNNKLSVDEATNQAMSIINENYDIRAINDSAYRMPSQQIGPVDRERIHKQLSNIAFDKKFLSGIVLVPENEETSTYINQVSRHLNWVTNEDETGVYLINEGANGSQVINKDTGKRIEYTWQDLVSKATITEKTDAEIRSESLIGGGLDTENITGESIREQTIAMARKKQLLRDQAYKEMGKKK